jgi:outer membrane protease
MPPKWTPKVMEAVNSSMHEDTIANYNKAFELTTNKWFLILKVTVLDFRRK